MDPIEELLTRGVDAIYPSKDELEKVLRSGKKLKLYQGFDPTGTQLHIGHMIGLRKLAQWQKLGHKVIFLIGDGTGQAGDPSGKIKSRNTFYNQAELRSNAKDYVLQAKKIIDFDAKNVEILYNGDWLNKLTLTDILDIANHFSVQQLIERDMFQERIKRTESINLREFLYPLLQGYDSVVMEVDLEMGGSDQTFNMLVGRRLLKEFKNKEKFVLTTPLLIDSQGVKIGKSEGNIVGLTDKPKELYQKLMSSLGDDVIINGFEYLTDVPLDQVRTMEKDMKEGKNPMDFKKKLALEITRQLNSEKEAVDAQVSFSEGEIIRRNITLPHTMVSGTSVSDVMASSGLAGSISEAKRVTAQGGTAVWGEIITDPNAPAYQFIKNDEILIKRKFNEVKIKFSK